MGAEQLDRRMAVAQLVRLLQSQRIEALHVELAARLVVGDTTSPAPVKA